MPLTSDHVYNALRTVNDPDLQKDLVTLNMVKDVQIQGEIVVLNIELTTPACPLKDKIEDDIVTAVKAKGKEMGEAVSEVKVEFSADVKKAQNKGKDNPLPNVRHVIAVGAGKGGVGKSTIAVSLAIGLSRLGAKVGLLDGDIYGPSLKTMLGLEDLPTNTSGKSLLAFEAHGIKAMTIAKLVPDDKALIWRGPMAHGAFKQLATQTDWGELDYLIVDLPPGTGDVPLTLAQLLPLSGAVVVCTPQKVARDDAVRAIKMFQQLGVDVLGIVENMSYFIGDDGKTYDIFGRGGAQALAQELSLPFLGAVPINMQLRANCDNGEPLKNWEDDQLAEELDTLCKNLASQISIATLSGKFIQPTLSIT